LLARLLDSPNEESRRSAIRGFALGVLRQPPGVTEGPVRPPTGMSRDDFELYQQYFPYMRNCEANAAECIRFWKSWYRDTSSRSNESNAR